MEKQIILKGNTVTFKYNITDDLYEEEHIIIKIQGKPIVFDYARIHNKELASKIVHQKLLNAAMEKFPDAEYFIVSGQCMISLNMEEYNNLKGQIDKIRRTYAANHTNKWNQMVNKKIRKIDSEIENYEALLEKYKNRKVYTKKELKEKAKVYNNMNNEGMTNDYNPYYYELDLETYQTLPREILEKKQQKKNLEATLLPLQCRELN